MEENDALGPADGSRLGTSEIVGLGFDESASDGLDGGCKLGRLLGISDDPDAGPTVSTVMTLEPSGSNQVLSLEVDVPPPLHDLANAPYQSGALFPHAAAPPWSWPTILWSKLNRGDPDDPGSVVPRSQSGTRMWLPPTSTVYDP